MSNSRILFVAPRFHTNQYFLTKQLIENGYSIKFISIYKGGSENHEFVEPLLSKPSLLCRLIFGNPDIVDARSRKYLRKYHITSFKQLFDLYFLFKPQIVIIRNLKSIYSIQHLLFALLTWKKIFLYTQNMLHQELSFRRKIFWKIVGLFGIIHYTPVLGNTQQSKIPNTVYIPFIIDKLVDQLVINARKNRRNFRIVTIGKMVERKKIKELILALSRVSKFNNVSNELIVISECISPDNHRYYESLQQLVGQIGFTITYHLNIHHKEVLEILKESDLFILPSNDEPAAFSIVEAMSSGLPVISSDKNGTSCYIHEGHNGFVFKYTDDLDNLTKVVETILKRNTLNEFGSESLSLVEKFHNIKKYLNIFS